MKKALLLLLLLSFSLTLSANDILFNKGDKGVYINVSRTRNMFIQRLNEISAGFTFTNGANLNVAYARYFDERWYDWCESTYPAPIVWYNKYELGYSWRINDRSNSKFPVDITLESGYCFGSRTDDYGTESNLTERMSNHSIKAGISASYAFPLFKVFEILPAISGYVHEHVYALRPGMETFNNNAAFSFSGEVIAKYKFIYAFIQYDRQIDPFNISLYSFYNVGWHGGLGMAFTL